MIIPIFACLSSTVLCQPKVSKESRAITIFNATPQTMLLFFKDYREAKLCEAEPRFSVSEDNGMLVLPGHTKNVSFLSKDTIYYHVSQDRKNGFASFVGEWGCSKEIDMPQGLGLKFSECDLVDNII